MSLNNISRAEEYSFMNQETFKFLHHKVASLIKMMVMKKVMMAYIHCVLVMCLELTLTGANPLFPSLQPVK